MEDLQKSIRLLDEQGLASPCIDDISHVIANLLKWWYQDQPIFEIFLSACGRVSGKLKQTVLACLAPPKVQTKARFMNVHRLIRWADRLLGLSPAGGARKGAILSKLRGCLDQLPSCRAFIKRFRDDDVPLLECQRILKAQGLSHSTIAQCEPFIQAIGSAPIRGQFTLYLQVQLQTAAKLGLDHIGLPVSSDQIEILTVLRAWAQSRPGLDSSSSPVQKTGEKVENYSIFQYLTGKRMTHGYSAKQGTIRCKMPSHGPSCRG
jgi:hypothetical protein